jgi:hypothetical protein
MNNKTVSKSAVIFSFLLVPFLASIISSWHVVKFFALGDPGWMSIMLAATIEIGSIASLIALSVLSKIRKSMVYFMFSILLIVQLVGNIYSVFDFVNAQLVIHPNWLYNFVELLTPLFGKIAPATYKFILSLFIGIPIPLISLSFLKSLVDYLEVAGDSSPDATTATVSSEPIVFNKPLSAPDNLPAPNIETLPVPAESVQGPSPIAQNEPVAPELTKEVTKALWDDPWPELTLKTAEVSETEEDDIAKYTNTFE